MKKVLILYWDKKNIQIDTQIRGVNQMGIAKKKASLIPTAI